MIWKNIGSKFDAQVAKGTEQVARRIHRRDALRTAVLTGAATVGAVALGQTPAFATITCPARCCCSPFCSGCPATSGCPSGHHLCTKPSVCGSVCEWSTGSWVHCQGYGKCGLGFTLCQDCKPTNNCNVCICISGVLCAQCCKASEVHAEYQKILERAGSAH